MSSSLWKPYADCESFDVRQTHIKEEPVSPPPEEQKSPRPQYSPGYGWSYSSPACPWLQDCVPSQCSILVTQLDQGPVPTSGISSPSRSSYGVDAHPRPATLSSPKSSPATEPLEPNSLDEEEEFLAFERNAVRVMALKNGGSLVKNNPRMRRTVSSASQNAADEAYRTKRQRNNLAAKQSRDKRKMREIHLAFKVTYLTNTVAKLKAQLAGRYCEGCHQPWGSPK